MHLQSAACKVLLHHIMIALQLGGDGKKTTYSW